MRLDDTPRILRMETALGGSSLIEMTALRKDTPNPVDGEQAIAVPLLELRWRAAYQLALDRVPSEMPLGQGLIRLLCWPNLSRLPDELVVPVTRICALLWRKPTVGFLVSRVLGAPQRETCALLGVLQEFGHVGSPRQDLERAEVTAPEREGALPLVRASNSLVGKLWLRLVGY